MKTCFVGSRSRALQGAGAARARDVLYAGAERARLRVSGATRERAAEPLFARDNELASLPDIVLQVHPSAPGPATSLFAH